MGGRGMPDGSRPAWQRTRIRRYNPGPHRDCWIYPVVANYSRAGIALLHSAHDHAHAYGYHNTILFDPVSTTPRRCSKVLSVLYDPAFLKTATHSNKCRSLYGAVTTIDEKVSPSHEF